MQITRKINLNVKRTVENSVAGSEDFHFFVDELASGDYMPTYAGMADEKYTFDEMNGEFFEFLERKASMDGIYIRLVHASCIASADDEVVFELEYGGKNEEFRTCNPDDVLAFEFADFGIKVMESCVTLGATVEGGCCNMHYFANFGSKKANVVFLSLENPLNQKIISIMENMIFSDE